MLNPIIRSLLGSARGGLVLPDNCALPKRCAICNKEVSTPPRRLRIKSSLMGNSFRRYTIYLHLCGWHASRRRLVLILSGITAISCGLIASTALEGHKPSNSQIVAFCGFGISALFFRNSLWNDPYFRGLDEEQGGLSIKGFGKRFRESLRPEEIVVVEGSELPSGFGKPG